MDRRRVRVSRWYRSAAGDGDHSPGAQVDAVTVAQRYGFAGRDVLAVDHDAIVRAGVDDRPVPVRPGDQHGVQPRYPRIDGRAGQVDFRLDVAGHAAPPDADLRPGEREPPLRDEGREYDRRGVLVTHRLHALVVGAIRGHHRG